MAAGKDQTQAIVLDAVVFARERSRIDDGPDFVLVVVERVEPRSPADAVDRLETAGRDEPCPRVVGDSIERPLLERRAERVVQRFLGDIEIAEQADQRGENAARFGAIDRLNLCSRVQRAVDDASFRVRSAQQAGRPPREREPAFGAGDHELQRLERKDQEAAP